MLDKRVQEEGLLFFDKEERGHQGIITDLQMSPDGTYFITSSKDKSAKVRSRLWVASYIAS